MTLCRLNIIQVVYKLLYNSSYNIVMMIIARWILEIIELPKGTMNQQSASHDSIPTTIPEINQILSPISLESASRKVANKENPDLQQTCNNNLFLWRRIYFQVECKKFFTFSRAVRRSSLRLRWSLHASSRLRHWWLRSLTFLDSKDLSPFEAGTWVLQSLPSGLQPWKKGNK